MTTYIFDTETTDAADPQIIQAAWLQLKNFSLEVVDKRGKRYRLTLSAEAAQGGPATLVVSVGVGGDGTLSVHDEHSIAA